MGNGEIHGFDPVEIVGVEGVLASRSTRAGGLRGPRQSVIHHRVEYGSRMRLDLGDRLLELPPCPDQGPDMLDRLRLIELDEAGPGHGIHRFACRIRYQMQMVVLLMLVHLRRSSRPSAGG